MITVAEVLADSLREAGVQVVFGLPGGEVVEVLDALRRVGIRFVLVHNESSAVFMADATARLTGIPGVCLTTLGPGATNATAGVAHAYLDRAPVLVVTAQTPERLRPHHTHQVIDLQRLFAPITKGSFVLQPENVRQTVQTSLALVQEGRPGPVHLQISNEDASRPAHPPSLAGGGVFSRSSHAEFSAPLVAARHVLAQARQPVIVAGLGLEPEKPYAALRELAEAAHAPVITTPKGKGSLPDDHPLAAGTVGLTRSDPVYTLLDEADCIVAVGFDVVELVKPWVQPAPLIWVANWPNADPTLPAVAQFTGPIQPVLAQLADASFGTAPDWGEKRVVAYREAQDRQSLPTPAEGRMLPQTVLQALRACVPRDTLVTVDVGSHKILGCLAWPAYAPNRFLVSNGLSCMGFGLPAAIGAALALPGQVTVSLIGDAGLAMVVGELGLLARYYLPLIVVVLIDNAIDLIRSHQVRAGKPVFGTEFSSPDFTHIAQAFQMDAVRVTNEEEFAEAVLTAVAAARPTLIEVLLDPVSYPTTPRKTTDG